MNAVLQRKCACGTLTPGGATCASCAGGKKDGLQRKLTIGSINDPLEHEADRVAEQVLASQAESDFSRVPVSVRRHAPGGAQQSQEVPPSVDRALAMPGRPLDAPIRRDMETRFGHDFSQVRVHQGAAAEQSARDVDAKAYAIGNNIVFASGEYAPGSPSGRRLLAHELAHVVQQGAAPAASASSPIANRSDRPTDKAASVGAAAAWGRNAASAGIIRRVPAAPSHNKVTGSIDLSKLQFSPIPDFKAGDLTAALRLTPKLADPDLVHLSWELYDPTDDLIEGYSTLPGHGTSKTSTFDLKPEWFQSGKARTGRYTMRLVGRNAKHEPIAYFDRYFFVLAKDLTTGTADSSGFGDLTFTAYGKTDGDFANDKDYSVDVKIKFEPKVDAVTCDEIGFLQVLESSTPAGKSTHPYAGDVVAARATPLNYTIDRTPTGPSPFYGTFRNPGDPTKIEPSNTTYKPGKGGHAPTAATLEDTPSWNQSTTDHFETCITCRKGANSGQVYGCATWGFSVDATGKVTLMPRSFGTTPSDTLAASLSNWNAWRAKQGKPTDYEAGPALK